MRLRLVIILCVLIVAGFLAVKAMGGRTAKKGDQSVVAGELKLPSLFSDNMVLQRDVDVPIWGTASPGEQITVSVAKQKVQATADAKGHWMARLSPMKAGGPWQIEVSGKTKVTLHNVLVGDVWLCSGQSNMGLSVVNSDNGLPEIAAASHPTIRLFTVPEKIASQPQSDAAGNWSVCSPQSVPSFSAVAYYFGRDLQKEISVPIGLIHASFGGTPIEAWSSRSMLDTFPEYQKILSHWDRMVSKHVPNLELMGRPTCLYDGMIAPLIPYAIKGVIWYQGEANVGQAPIYARLFPAMIQDWRKKWGNTFPFVFVQIASWQAHDPQPAESDMAELREAQTSALSLPQTAMVVTIDVGDATTIHPKNKLEVGRRLSAAALATAYGRNIVHSGPVYDSMKVEGSKIRINFKDPAEKLTAKGGALQGFAIAGADHHYLWANASIDKDSVLVGSDQVSKPIAVRYDWGNNPIGNLYNAAELPAVPFRTDDWTTHAHHGLMF